ncbi:unnamed protein product [Brassica oleracea var. botrytis]
MIRSAKALRIVRPLLLDTGTLRISLFHSSERAFSSSTDRKISSYKERLRSGLVNPKKDDAVDLFQSMIQSRPLPTVIDFNRLFGLLSKTKQYDLVLHLCKQMELQGIAYDLYTLNITINCFRSCGVS